MRFAQRRRLPGELQLEVEPLEFDLWPVGSGSFLFRIARWLVTVGVRHGFLKILAAILNDHRVADSQVFQANIHQLALFAGNLHRAVAQLLDQRVTDVQGQHQCAGLCCDSANRSLGSPSPVPLAPDLRQPARPAALHRAAHTAPAGGATAPGLGAPGGATGAAAAASPGAAGLAAGTLGSTGVCHLLDGRSSAIPGVYHVDRSANHSHSI